MKDGFRTESASQLKANDLVSRASLCPGLRRLLGPAGIAAVLFAGAASPAAAGDSAWLLNVSARAQVGGGAGTPVAGFVIGGSGSKPVLLRAAGPALGAFGVTNALADPSLSLLLGTIQVASNDNWLPKDAAAMAAAFAFPFAVGSRDAAIVATLSPGAYTAPVAAADGGTGVSLIELYDTSNSNASPIANASVRAYVGASGSVLVPGFVVGGPGTLRMLIRAIGPTLGTYGVSGALADPTITLYSGATALATNDNWSDAANAADIAATAAAVGAFPLSADSRDAAILVDLPAGSYTAAVSGSGSGTGTALVEMYAAGSTAPFTMTQTLSDEAQRTTLAFSGLALMTGNLQSQSFFPPGKVADYTGFQYLRDNDPANMGHNTDFMTNVANNVLYILNDAQLAQLIALGTAQQGDIDSYGYGRYALIKAFRRLIDGDIPSGSAGLNVDSVKKASRALYITDGQIAFDRAILYASIYRSMANGTPCNSDSGTTQLAYLAAMKNTRSGSAGWPVLSADQLASINERMKGLPNGVVVAVMTYAGDIFSWYAGSLDSDVYFCPERHGTYYGGFYIKDAPAVNVPGYSISEQLTATAGAALSDSSQGYVTAAQAALFNALVDTQRNNLYAGSTNIVQIRTQIATLLRGLLASTANSASVRTQVLALSGTYGDLDGQNNCAYATTFAQVYRSLSGDQKVRLAALRRSIMTGTYANGTPYDFTTCATYFLYSDIITDPSLLAPYIGNTDYLFFEP